MNVIVSPHLILGYKQRRRHKKWRISKKWAKRYGFEPVYDMEHTYVIGNQIIMSQGMFDKLKKEVGNEVDTSKR